ncbi:hypothetical protein GCM10008164_11600 [Achromobacter xylosoxidans]|nr:hypothetical protein GCM10008164_11600 [Achromobacter xylosoxidans]
MEHVAHGISRHADLPHARLHARGRVVDQALDFLGGLRAALGQRPHLARHHRKSLALLARTRRFHGGVERENIGLESDAVHHADNLANTTGALGNALHALHDFLDRLAATLRQLGGAKRLPAGQIGVTRGQLHGVRQLHHVGRRFLQRPRLARRAIRHVRATRCDFARAGMNFFHAVAHRSHGRRQPRLHAPHGAVQDADLVVAARRNRARQVAVGDAVEMRTGLVQGPQDVPAESQPDQHGQQQNQRQHARRHRDHPLQRKTGAGDRGLALVSRIGLIGAGLLHIGSAAGRQHLVHQTVHLDPIPALDRRVHGSQRLLGEGGVGCQHAVE